MGETTDMILNGFLCEGCGVLMDNFESPGYPRLCEECEKEKD